MKAKKRNFSKKLLLPTENLAELKNEAFKIRERQVIEAKKFKRGISTSKQKFTTLYKYDGYEIRVGKPGKEFNSTKLTNKKTEKKGRNVNDMWPIIFRNKKRIDVIGSFEGIFEQFTRLLHSQKNLKLLGCLFIRNAFVLDHKKNKKGNFRYSPPRNILNKICDSASPRKYLPFKVFIFYLEVITLNEDVKYRTLGHDIKSGTGRINNMLTYANVIKLLLKKNEHTEMKFMKEVGKFIGEMTRTRGINPISLSEAIKVFPQLTSQ